MVRYTAIRLTKGKEAARVASLKSRAGSAAAAAAVAAEARTAAEAGPTDEQDVPLPPQPIPSANPSPAADAGPATQKVALPRSLELKQPTGEASSAAAAAEPRLQAGALPETVADKLLPPQSTP